MPDNFQSAVENRLVAQAAVKPRLDYNVKRLSSYAGYPVIPAQELGLMDYFKKDGVDVAGMAWGGNTNPLGQGRGEPSSIVPNPYLFKNNNLGYNALVKLEASRHYMNETGYKPSFKITPEIAKWREQFNPDKIGPAGKAYYTDDNALKQTIISRIIAGDENIPELLTPELKKEADFIKSKIEDLDKKAQPSTSDKIMKASIFAPNKQLK